MLFEFGNDFGPPSETIAGVWHKGNDPIGRHPIVVVDVVDGYLHPRNQLAWRVSSCSAHSIRCIECAAATND